MRGRHRRDAVRALTQSPAPLRSPRRLALPKDHVGVRSDLPGHQQPAARFAHSFLNEGAVGSISSTTYRQTSSRPSLRSPIAIPKPTSPKPIRPTRTCRRSVSIPTSPPLSDARSIRAVRKRVVSGSASPPQPRSHPGCNCIHQRLMLVVDPRRSFPVRAGAGK